MSFVYLASPYSHPHTWVQELRYSAARDALAYLLQRHIWTYSPIVHCHHLAAHHNLPRGFQFWVPYNHAMLRASNALYVLDIPGTTESKGVADEIKLADKLGTPITYMTLVCGSYAFDPPLNHSIGIAK